MRQRMRRSEVIHRGRAHAGYDLGIEDALWRSGSHHDGLGRERHEKGRDDALGRQDATDGAEAVTGRHT